MENRWSEDKAAQFIEKFGADWGRDLAIRLYTSYLIGSEVNLVLHGGGNASVKTLHTDLWGNPVEAIYVKASGYDMASIAPGSYTGLDLAYLKKLRSVPGLTDEEMAAEFRSHLLGPNTGVPSIETLLHAFIPGKFADHTHPDAILAISNQAGGQERLRDALGDAVPIARYFPSGFKLAKAVAEMLDSGPTANAIVLMQHGLATWGETARDSYDTTIELVNKAEKYILKHTRSFSIPDSATPVSLAEERYARIAPILRGALALQTGNQDRPWLTSIIQPLITKEILGLLDTETGREIAASGPLTSDHLIRTKASYLWVEEPAYDDLDKLRQQISGAVGSFAEAYNAYVDRHADRMPAGVDRMDALPRVLLMPGLGAVCAGRDIINSTIVRDITAHTLDVKQQIEAMGAYRGLDEGDLFDMEYKILQHSKLKKTASLPLERQTALITGAAGAIGAGIAEELLEQGCHVALSDLDATALAELAGELRGRFGPRVLGVVLDISDARSVAEGFRTVIRAWGGVDIVILNAGLAHVSALENMDMETFRKLERVNVEGVLHMLSESARHFKCQGTGGDIVLLSTKNVFAPGARFGAYSATKTAAHQLARIASQEFAAFGVRVNMVAPDAVFSHGDRKSGLWSKIGPDRMAARGLSAEGLEDYYRNRNLLKARITARHVSKAVLFFVTRQTPTTGATLPVDGGLPDATPR